MAYSLVWKLNEDGTFSTVDIGAWRYIETEARVHADMIPRWLTDDPMTEDFTIWANSVPRHEKNEFLLEFDRINEEPIIEILEREGTIEKGSYQKPSGGYEKERIHSGAIQENTDCHRNRRKNWESSWNFPESDSSGDSSWYAQKRVTRHDAERRKSNI